MSIQIIKKKQNFYSIREPVTSPSQLPIRKSVFCCAREIQGVFGLLTFLHFKCVYFTPTVPALMKLVVNVSAENSVAFL
jgi:hypothetical protein